MASVLSAILAVCVLQVLATEPELKIDKLYTPEVCEQKTKNGDLVTIHYNGTLTNGTMFDCNREEPLLFELGSGKAIKGLDLGLVDMCVGEKRKLTIPPSLGFGERGVENVVPGGATLIYEIELFYIGKPKPNMFKIMDADHDNMLSKEEVSEYLMKRILKIGASENPVVKQMIKRHDRLVEQIFTHEDKDMNGFISHAEYSGPKYDEF